MYRMVDRLISGSHAGERHRRTLSGGDHHPRHVGDPGRSNIKVAFGSTAISEYRLPLVTVSSPYY